MRRREGELTLGLWLPLACATLVQCVLGFGGKPPPRSEILDGWALPELAKMAKREEVEAQNAALVAYIDDIEKRFGRQEGGRQEHTTHT